MRVISRKRLRDFWESHDTARIPLTRWFRLVRKASWKSPNDARATFGTVDFVTGPNRTLAIFNVGGNNFRLSAAIHFNTGRVYIRRVMTHQEYDAGAWREDL